MMAATPSTTPTEDALYFTCLDVLSASIGMRTCLTYIPALYQRSIAVENTKN